MTPIVNSVNHKVLIAFSGLLLVALLTLGAARWATFSTRSAAKALLLEIRALRVGEVTFANAEKLSTIYASYRTSGSEPCSSKECNFAFGFDNGWLHKLGLAPYTVLTYQLYVTNGRVAWIELMMATDPIAKAVVEESLAGRDVSPYDVNGKLVTLGSVSHAILIDVKFTPQANPSQKERSLAFNLSCLTSIGGCKYSEEMLPQVRLDGQPADR